MYPHGNAIHPGILFIVRQHMNTVIERVNYRLFIEEWHVPVALINNSHILFQIEVYKNFAEN